MELGFVCIKYKKRRSKSLTFFTNLFLFLFEAGEGHKEVLVDVLLSEELHRPLENFPAVGDVAVLLFEAGVLNPVLHIGMDEHKFTGVKEISKPESRQAIQAQW